MSATIVRSCATSRLPCTRSAPFLGRSCGSEPNQRGPEVDYGWIQAAEPLTLAERTILMRRVRQLWEQPSLELARRLLDVECLWNLRAGGVDANATQYDHKITAEGGRWCSRSQVRA